MNIMNSYDHQDRVVVTRRAEIDTRAPFRSVREAVALFGEKVLAGEVYADKLKEMRGIASETGLGGSTQIGNITAELEETKQSLEKAKEESTLMANYLSSLEQELERTKRELREMKEKESEKQMMMEFECDSDHDYEIEDVKFVEESVEFQVVNETHSSKSQSPDDHHVEELQKKRNVRFANPPSLAQVIVPKNVQLLERHPSLKKKKKKPLIPLIGAIFSKNSKTGSHENKY